MRRCSPAFFGCLIAMFSTASAHAGELPTRAIAWSQMEADEGTLGQVDYAAISTDELGDGTHSVAFWGEVLGEGEALWSDTSGEKELVAATWLSAPDAGANWEYFDRPAIQGEGDLAFWGIAGGVAGIWKSGGGGVEAVAIEGQGFNGLQTQVQVSRTGHIAFLDCGSPYDCTSESTLWVADPDGDLTPLVSIGVQLAGTGRVVEEILRYGLDESGGLTVGARFDVWTPEPGWGLARFDNGQLSQVITNEDSIAGQGATETAALDNEFFVAANGTLVAGFWFTEEDPPYENRGVWYTGMPESLSPAFDQDQAVTASIPNVTLGGVAGPILAESGEVLFYCSLAGDWIKNGANNGAVCLWDGATVTALLQQEDPAPVLGGPTLQVPFGYGVTDGGDPVISALLTGTGVDSTNYSVLYFWQDGEPEVLSRMGETMTLEGPGEVTITSTGSPAWSGGSSPRATFDDEVVWTANWESAEFWSGTVILAANSFGEGDQSADLSLTLTRSGSGPVQPTEHLYADIYNDGPDNAYGVRIEGIRERVESGTDYDLTWDDCDDGCTIDVGETLQVEAIGWVAPPRPGL